MHPIKIAFNTADTIPNEHYLLARFTFDTSISATGENSEKICVMPNIMHTGLRQLTSPTVCIDWLSTSSVTPDTQGNIYYVSNPDVLYGQIRLNTALPLDAMIQRAYEDIFALLATTDTPHLIRVWHFLPDIALLENGVSRYHLFCRGRQLAFGGTAVVQRCAATVIGTHHSHQPIMCFIATHQPGKAVENPQQTNPWEYPNIHSGMKPIFTRAMYSSSLATLFISGTASIVGYQSTHKNDTGAQLIQAIEHLATLIHSASQTQTLTHCLEYLLIYTKHIDKADILYQNAQQILTEVNLSVTQIIVLEGEVCRPELDVELEACVRMDIDNQF